MVRINAFAEFPVAATLACGTLIALTLATGAQAQDPGFQCVDSGRRPESTLWDYSTWLYRALDPSEANPTRMRGIPPVSTPAPAAALAPGERRIVFFGDLMAPDKEELPLAHPQLRALFASADLVIGNMEAPVYRGALDTGSSQWFDFHASTGFVRSFFAQFCVDPARMVFTVANNHAADHGRWPETLLALVPSAEWGPDDAALTPPPVEVRGVVGRPASSDDQVDVYDLGAMRVGVVAWTEVENCAPDPAWGDEIWRRGDAMLSVDWEQVKAERDIDVLIGVPHWDRQFYYFPSAQTQQRGRALLASGFDLVVGADPHVLQPAQRNADGMVFHSLGGLNVNFGWLSGTSLVLAAEVIVDVDGAVKRYAVHPFAQRKAATGTRLPAASQCAFPGGARTMYDVGRSTASEVVPLSEVSNGWGVRARLADDVELVFPSR